MIFFRYMQGVQELLETLYSLSFQVLSASKVIRCLNFQQAVFGHCQLEDGCVFQSFNGAFRL